MSFPVVPRAQDATLTLRQRARAGLEAAAVCFMAGAAVTIAFVSDDTAFSAAEILALIPIGILLTLIGTITYMRRIGLLRSAQTMNEERDRLTTIVEGTGGALWESDMQHNLLYCSDRWGEMLGMVRDAREPLSVEEWARLVHPDDNAVVSAAVTSCINMVNHVFEVEFRIRHADGRYLWVISRGKVMERAADGKPLRMVGTQLDISAQKIAELALEDSERKFRSLFERSPVGIALTDFHSGRILQVNDALLEPTGYSREELLTMHFEQLVSRRDPLSSTESIAQGEREFLRRDGTSYPVLMSGIRMTDPSGRDVVWSIVQDISHRKAVERELAAAARRDRLTGLANRTLFMERLRHSVERVRAGKQAMFAVLFLDFDRFKVVNDAMGHQAGDELLVQIAERLRKALRSSDGDPKADSRNQIARFGGDEFLVLINDIERPQDAARIADRVLASLSNVYQIQGREVHSTASIGIVTSDHCLEGAETIIRNADVAMYEAKRAGRACSVFFNDAMHTRLSRNLMIETSLRKALGTDQMSLVYQPIVELDTGKRSSVEALIRWTHPALGPLSPAEFVPVAEESGLIVQMGEWVMRESCAALARWRELDPVRAPAVVSVNVSRAELAQGPRLLRNVRAALDAAGLPYDSLQLEVTEREVMRDPKASLALMNQLREIGVRLAMDDFGTGTSSLACLRDYPFDVIKIDRAFVNGLSAGADTLAVIHATITLVENLGKHSVAEGVETPEQLAILQSLGCHYAQGYLLGYPMAEADVVEAERTIIAPRLQLLG